jgi:tetratricopeptide (TPR) repeat protein
MVLAFLSAGPAPVAAQSAASRAGEPPAASPTRSGDSPAASLLSQGAEAYQRGDLKSAATAFAEAARVAPDDARTHYHLCAARMSLGEGQRALDDCGRAIRLDPSYSQAYYVRGLIRTQQLGDNAGGIVDFDVAIRLRPDHAPSHLKRGNARARLGDLRGGLADYDRAIVLDARYGDAYFNRGVVRYHLKDRRGALEDLDQAAGLAREQGDKQAWDRARSAIQQVQSE